MEFGSDFHFDEQSLLRLECESVDMSCNKDIYGLIDIFSESLLLGPDDLYSKIKGISANFEKKGLNLDNVEERVAAGTSFCSSLELSNFMDSSSSTEEDCCHTSEGSSELSRISNGDSSKCQNLGFQLGEIEKLLKILEEDNHVMGKALFVGVEERSELVNEVYRLFQVIQQRIRDHQTIDEKSLPGSVTSFNEDVSTAIGLPQVLLQERNPSIVTRGRVLKANILAFDQKPTSTQVL